MGKGKREKYTVQSNGISGKHMSMFATLILLKDFAEISLVSPIPGRSGLVQVLASILNFQVHGSKLPR